MSGRVRDNNTTEIPFRARMKKPVTSARPLLFPIAIIGNLGIDYSARNFLSTGNWQPGIPMLLRPHKKWLNSNWDKFPLQ
jgi:hypothetical protein